MNPDFNKTQKTAPTEKVDEDDDDEDDFMRDEDQSELENTSPDATT